MTAYMGWQTVVVILQERPQFAAGQEFHLVVERAVVLEGGELLYDEWVVQLVENALLHQNFVGDIWVATLYLLGILLFYRL